MGGARFTVKLPLERYEEFCLILNEGIISFKLQALITLLVRLISYNNQSSFLCFRGCPQKKDKKIPRGGRGIL